MYNGNTLIHKSFNSKPWIEHEMYFIDANYKWSFMILKHTKQHVWIQYIRNNWQFQLELSILFVIILYLGTFQTFIETIINTSWLATLLHYKIPLK